jgi:hypothetical protein
MTPQKNQSFIAVVAKSIGNGSKEFSGCGSQQARKPAPELWGPKGGELRWELFHREEHPALERDIIDMPEWT